jgi:hypothetical protein
MEGDERRVEERGRRRWLEYTKNQYISLIFPSLSLSVPNIPLSKQLRKKEKTLYRHPNFI